MLACVGETYSFNKSLRASATREVIMIYNNLYSYNFYPYVTIRVRLYHHISIFLLFRWEICKTFSRWGDFVISKKIN
jgi:hypothetical protein